MYGPHRSTPSRGGVTYLNVVLLCASLFIDLYFFAVTPAHIDDDGEAVGLPPIGKPSKSHSLNGPNYPSENAIGH